MKILDETQIKQKTKRLALEILENNLDEQELYFVGINDNGLYFAKSIGYYLTRLSEIKLHYAQVHVEQVAQNHEVQLSLDIDKVQNKVVVLIDDVANSGRTIFYSLKPFMDGQLKKVEIAVLVDRMHKSYPIHPNYVGLTLATTTHEHIDVQIKSVEKKAVYLV